MVTEISVGRNKTFHELNPLFCGYEHCIPGHTYGPAVREYYLIHYILSGEGYFTADGERHHLKKGECFLIKPRQITKYWADMDHPWYYVWIGFNGELAADFEKLPPVWKPNPGIFYEIRRVEEIQSLRKEYLTGILFQMYCELFQDRKQEKDYAGEIREFIQYNYMSEITVEGLASMVNIDRRYLSRLFRARYGVTMKRYLTEYRMEKAAQFLQSGVSVANAADMVGYKDVCNFSKMFRKIMGVCPAECREGGKEIRRHGDRIP